MHGTPSHPVLLLVVGIVAALLVVLAFASEGASSPVAGVSSPPAVARTG